MSPTDGLLTLQDATIIFRNFAGREGMYNSEGDRNFCLLLEDEVALAMDRDGWNIKHLKMREEDIASGGTPQPYLQVSVGFKIRPPRMFLITHNGRTAIDEETVELLDWVDIKTVDLTIRPYQWAVGGKTGIKAYLKTLYIVVNEDPLDLKWSSLEELPARAGQVHEIEAAPEVEIIEGTWSQ
jgi:hypothetical protein